jgi:hypothetical protein
MTVKASRPSAIPLIVALALLVFPPALYVLSYCLLAEYGYLQSGIRVASYRWGGVTAERVFQPLEWADRRLRPDQWEPLCVSPAEPPY